MRWWRDRCGIGSGSRTINCCSDETERPGYNISRLTTGVARAKNDRRPHSKRLKVNRPPPLSLLSFTLLGLPVALRLPFIFLLTLCSLSSFLLHARCQPPVNRIRSPRSLTLTANPNPNLQQVLVAIHISHSNTLFPSSVQNNLYHYGHLLPRLRPRNLRRPRARPGVHRRAQVALRVPQPVHLSRRG